MALPYQAAVTGNPYKNNGCVIAKTGAHTVLAGVNYTKSYGPKVSLSSGTANSSGNVGTSIPLAGLTFAYEQVAHQFQGVKMTQDLCGVHAGVTPTIFGPASSSSETMRSIPYLETTRTLGSGITASMNYVTGHFTKGGNAGGTTSFGQDHAASPTNALPGELTYKTGALLPASGDYKPKVSP